MIKILIETCYKITDTLYHVNGYDFIVNMDKKTITCKCAITQIYIAELNEKDELLRLINTLKQ